MSFELGNVVMTIGVDEYVKENNLAKELITILRRHHSGDWGDLVKSDKDENDRALKEGGRLFSTYKLGEEKVYIITEWDRSATTILFPYEY